MNPPPPPPPPPHGANGAGRNGLPDGHYDIFVIPPHSAGGGFLYLPSLQPHRNSFLAGMACTMFAVMIWTIVLPVIRNWMSQIVAGGGASVVILLFVVGIVAWAWGKTQGEGGFAGGGAGGSHTQSNSHTAGPQPGSMPGTSSSQSSEYSNGASGAHYHAPPPQPQPKSTWQRSTTNQTAGSANAGAAKGGWEKAREETRKKEEERKKADELRTKRELDEKERIAQREKDARERAARERREKAQSGRPPSPSKAHQPPRADTATDDDAYSYRPYDQTKGAAHTYKTSASSIYSESSYAPSQSTNRTTPPPSHRGPYRSKDPDKIVIKAVYAFNNIYMKSPIAKLVSGLGSVTDGLILRITTEGLFIDDDVRGVPQREWDVKAWTLKLVESGEHQGLHVLRATVRDLENKRYVFVLQEAEAWKVAVGLQRLRRGSQVRALGVSGMAINETKAILENMGWI